MDQQQCINIEGVNDTCNLNDPQIKYFYDQLPKNQGEDVYLPEWPLYIKYLNYQTRSHSKYYIQYNPQSGILRRVTVYRGYQRDRSSLIPQDNAEYLGVKSMIEHPQFGEYLGQLELYQTTKNYLQDFNKAFGVSRGTI